MAPVLIGGSDVPFGRTFFNVYLGEMLDRAGKDKDHKLTLFLGDGSQLDVCSIDELSDGYLILRAYRGGEGDACDLSLNLIPYGLIYRIEIAPKQDAGQRLGFHWVKPRQTTVRKVGK
jgi:hypothetical protein